MTTVMTTTEIKRKEKKYKELYEIEKYKNFLISENHKLIGRCKAEIIKVEKENERLQKSISHNMKLRNTITKEISEHKKGILKLTTAWKKNI